MNENLTISRQGIELIHGSEGLVLRAEIPTKSDVPTIGWGHTSGVKLGDTCTREQADRWFAEDASWVVAAIHRRVKVPLNQNQFDALASFVFNFGEPQFAGSTLLKLINRGMFAAAQDQFRLWIHGPSGQVEPGLPIRRAKEAQLFGTPMP